MMFTLPDGRYIEPFFGGGALFFALRPENAIIADSNPELVNMYRQVANNLDDVIDYLRGRENDIAFINLLNEKGIIQNEGGKDESGSHARKWRLMFSKNGLIYPKLDKKYGEQAALGKMDDITPFGRVFLKADTYPAVQECFLRAMSVEQFPLAGESSYFSPLRWILAIMLELEKRTGSSELSRIEFALWGHTTNPKYSLSEVVDNILDLRMRRTKAPAKKTFDRQEIAVRAKDYDKKSDNFLDYSDMNMRYTFIIRANRKEVPDMMSILKKIVLFPVSLFVAFLALMAKWLLTLSSYVVAPLMLYIFGCGIYTAYRQTWDQFFILLVAEFICFVLFFGATAITEDIGRFSEWLAEL